MEKWRADSICKNIFNAIVNDDLNALALYKNHELNKLDTHTNETFLQAAIRYNKPKVFDRLVEYGINLNNASPFDGTTALHEAVRLNSTYFINKLINLGANVNVLDHEGFTPLNHAVGFEKYNLAEVLLKAPQIDVNIPSEMGATPIWYAFIYGKFDIFNKIMNHPSFDSTFNQIILNEYNLSDVRDHLLSQGKVGDATLINAYNDSKIFGLKFDLDGCMPLNNIVNHEYDCFSFEGYYRNQGALALADSYNQFYSDVITKSSIPSWASQSFISVKEAIDFSANIFEPSAYYDKLNRGELVIIPSGWEGHTITFVIYKDTLYRCNRGDESDGIHGIEEFKITKPSNLNSELIKLMLDAAGESKFLQYDLIDLLGLERVGMVENPVQLAGNCTWASLETSVEAAFISTFMGLGIDKVTAHQLAKQSFLEWEEFDLTYTLKDVIDHKEIFIAAEIYDDLLVRALETHHNPNNEHDIQRGLFLLNELGNSAVFEKFDHDIGQIVNKYAPFQVSQLSFMNTYSASYYDYIASSIDVYDRRMTKNEKQFAQEYLDFLKTCDNYKTTISSLPIDMNEVIMESFINGFETVFSYPNLNQIAHMLLPESTEHII